MARAKDPYESMIRQAMAHQRAGRGGDAAAIYDFVLSKSPGHPDALHLRGMLHVERGMPESAIEDIGAAIAVRGDVPAFHFSLGHACRLAGRLDEAVASYARALELAPGDERVLLALARVQEIRGDAEASRGAIAALSAGAREGWAAQVILARLRARDGDVVGAVEIVRPLVAARRDDREAVDLLFTAAQLLDRAGAHDEAAACAARANAAKGATFNRDAFRRSVTALMEVCAGEGVKGWRRGGARGEGLLYVVGMPRSGTSLVEQVLASHAQVGGGGELTVLPRLEARLSAVSASRAPYPLCLASVDGAGLARVAEEGLEMYERARPASTRGMARLTDKLPSNFRRLGPMSLLYPGARVVHCVRDAVDTCLSCYMQEFAGATHPYAYDLEDLATYCAAYERLMRFWRDEWGVSMVEVRYEELVSDQRRVTEGVLEGVGLAWDEACMRPHESRRRVATASYAQVREPVHGGSVGRGARYAEMMAPFVAALERERTLW